ncbi:MAG: outer membrane protein [Salibacteraceae bacterium]|jgi:outer membrane protein TolC
MNFKIGIFTLIAFVVSLTTNAQEEKQVLQKDQAVTIAMENNFDIRMSKMDVEVAENNASIQNSGYLPSITGTAGANYSNSSGQLVERSGATRDIENNETTGLNASVGLTYMVFDGFGRSNTYKQLQENYNISELQARQMVESTILSIFNSYYEVARLTQDVDNQKETLIISRVRLQRAQYGSEYGQGSQLDILNAEVDYNNDSITYLTNTQFLANEKRNLNLLLGRDVNIDFQVDTALTYANNLLLEAMLVNAKDNNVTLLQQEAALRNSELNIRATTSNAVPKLSVNGNYGYNQNQFGAAGFIDKSTGTGPSLGATLSWNIYDGGATRTRRQNSEIAFETQSINLEKQQLNIERNLSNAWTAYQTALFVKEAQSKNLQTAQTNFDRSVDQYKLGQITNIVFRQAQLNLLQAQLALNQAKYSAKTAELFLLQISGDLRQAQF